MNNYVLNASNQWVPASSGLFGNLDAQIGANLALVAQGAFNGTTIDRLRTATVFKVQNAVNVNAETTIWTPAAGKKFRILGYHLNTSVAGLTTLRDNTAGTIIDIFGSGAGGAGSIVVMQNGILSAAANNVLTATGPAASTLSGLIFGTEE